MLGSPVHVGTQVRCWTAVLLQSNTSDQCPMWHTSCTLQFGASEPTPLACIETSGMCRPMRYNLRAVQWERPPAPALSMTFARGLVEANPLLRYACASGPCSTPRLWCSRASNIGMRYQTATCSSTTQRFGNGERPDSFRVSHNVQGWHPRLPQPIKVNTGFP